MSRSACRAVIAATGTAAASSKLMFAGFGTTASRTVTYSASAPLLAPKTSSPGRMCVTFLPTASTVPAKSIPVRSVLGFSRPVEGRTMSGPATPYQSAGLIDAARTRTSARSSATSGFSTSSSSSTSGEPYLLTTIAFMMALLRLHTL